MHSIVRRIGTTRLMRIAQVVGAALVVLLGLSDYIPESSAHEYLVWIIGAALLVLGALPNAFGVRMPLISVSYSARFTGLLWGGMTPVILALAVFGLPATLTLLVYWLSGLFASAMTLYALTIGRTRLVVTNHELTVDSEFVGGRVAVLSDLHLGKFTGPNLIRKAVDLTNSIEPDLVILAGDLIDKDGSRTEELISVLEQLRPTSTVVAVLGNHDIGAIDHELISIGLKNADSIRLLRDETIDLELKPGEKHSVVRVIGVDPADDWWDAASESRATNVVENGTKSAPPVAIVACHHPDGFQSISEYDVDLMVAGHTHGGQLAIPGLRKLANVGSLATSYLWGSYSSNSTQLVVSAGIGVGLVPMRIGVPPEVTVIDLVAAPRST